MKIFNFKYQIIGQFLFVIIFLLTTSAKSLDKFDKADRMSDYFSGILLLNENQYENSLKYLKNLNNDLAKRYFLKAKSKNARFILNNYVANSLYNWSSLSDLIQAKNELEKLDKRFENLKKIQNTFLHCHFNSPKTNYLFTEITLDQGADFSRYNYFYASYIASKGQITKAQKIVKSALEFYPRNLLLNQYQIDLKENKNVLVFNCKNKEHVIAEILYITANALSSQSIYPQSNFYLNLAKHLNSEFRSYNTLLAENFYKTNNFQKAKQIYNNLSKNGDAFNWYSSKQLARIFVQQENKNEALRLLKKSYNSLLIKEIYDTFDYAEFLKNNEKFKESISFYTSVIKKIKKDHPLYAEAADGRGVAYERIGEWDKAEKDLLASLEVNPDQAYVINYLAYSWIEKGIKVNKSLTMLEKANKLRSNDPYITDSLGWALFKLERYQEAKNYLQLAVRLLPADPIVNDHYGDALWKNGDEIQARYYWNYVLNLEKIEEDLRKSIEEKLIKGL